ncbi:MAG: NAD-dependent epimerase/dehydratase family protein [Minicystis sp.]
MKIAVTGASGELGTLVLRRLAALPEVERIVALDVRAPMVASPKIEAVQVDVRDANIGAHLAGASALVHLAFLVTQWAPRAEMESVNVGGSKNVFEAAARAGIKTIVYSSSIAAYGVVPGHPVPIVETTPRRFQPEFAYSATKFQVEAFLDVFEKEHPDLTIARLRPAILAGTRMEHELGKSLDSGLFPDLGGPTAPFVWDDDVAAAVVLCLKQRAHGAFNLVADEPLQARELARAGGLRHLRIPRAVVRRVAQLNPLIVRLGGKRRADPAWLDIEPVRMVISSEKAKRELGWSPRYPTHAEVFRHVGETARRRMDPRIALFFRLAGASSARLSPRATNERDLHLEITGPGGGDFTLRTGGQRARLSPGVPRPPSAVLRAAAPVYLDLLAGRLSLGEAQQSGAVSVEGEAVEERTLDELRALGQGGWLTRIPWPFGAKGAKR